MQEQSHRSYRQREFLREAPSESALLTDMKPLSFLLKAFGFVPNYEVISNYEIGSPVRRNKILALLARGALFGMSAFLIYLLSVPRKIKYLSTSYNTDIIVRQLELMLIYGTFVIMLLTCIKKENSLLKIINDILRLDEEISRRRDVNLSNNCGFLSKYLLCYCALHAYDRIIRMWNAEQLSVTVICYNVSVTTQLTLLGNVVVYISALLQVLRVRFAFVNAILSEYSYKNQQLIKDSLACHEDEVDGMENFPEDSAFSLRLHTKLLVLTKSINDFCSFFLLGFISFSLYTLAAVIYNIFLDVTTRSQVSIIFVQSNIIWLMATISSLAILCNSCDRVINEANATSLVMARVYSKKQEHRNIIDKFLTKSLKQKARFTAFGFFTINKSTLFKIFCAVTTYLVIFIQFKQLEEAKET